MNRKKATVFGQLQAKNTIMRLQAAVCYGSLEIYERMVLQDAWFAVVCKTTRNKYGCPHCSEEA